MTQKITFEISGGYVSGHFNNISLAGIFSQSVQNDGDIKTYLGSKTIEVEAGTYPIRIQHILRAGDSGVLTIRNNGHLLWAASGYIYTNPNEAFGNLSPPIVGLTPVASVMIIEALPDISTPIVPLIKIKEAEKDCFAKIETTGECLNEVEFNQRFGKEADISSEEQNQITLKENVTFQDEVVINEEQKQTELANSSITPITTVTAPPIESGGKLEGDFNEKDFTGQPSTLEKEAKTTKAQDKKALIVLGTIALIAGLVGTAFYVMSKKK